MSSIETAFNARFAHWNITLPPGTVEHAGRGRIVDRGWAIRYLVDRDERGTYLDFYAAHRMTSDEHVRLREDGTREELPAIWPGRILSKDPEEDARLEARYIDHNRDVVRMLAEKGFGPDGGEPMGVLINRHLQTGGEGSS